MKQLQTEKGLAVEHFKVVEGEIPTPGKGQILVKLAATALNPVDILCINHGFLVPAFPAVLGCELAGVVEATGEGVTRFKKGDGVFGFSGVGKPNFGSFAEYALIDNSTAIKKPANITHEQAATVGVGSFTASLGIFKNFGIPLPSKGKQSGQLLVWGASGNVGYFAVQLARAAGFEVIATASPKNFEFVKKAGASHVFDYSDAETPEKIRKLTDGKIKYALDAVAKGDSTAKVLASVSHEEAHISTVLPINVEHPDTVKIHPVLLGMAEGAEILGFLGELSVEMTAALEAGTIQPAPVELIPGGLESGVAAGLLKLQGGVSAVKLVVAL